MNNKQRHIRFMLPVVLTLCLMAAGASGFENINDGRGFYSSYRHYNLIDVPERQGSVVVSEFGGMLNSVPSGEFQVHWRYVDHQFDFREHELKKTDFSLTSRYQLGNLGIHWPIIHAIIVLDMESGLSRHKTNTDFVSKNRLKITPLPFASFELFANRNSETFDLDGVFWGEEIRLGLHTSWVSSGFNGAIRLYRDAVVFAGYKDWESNNPDLDPDSKFSSIINGAAGYRYQGLTLGDPTGVHLKFMFSRLEMSGKLSLYSRGVKFGQVARIKGDIDRWRADMRLPCLPKNLTFALEYLDVTALATGHLEAWPFTDPLEDLLGLRRNFRANLDLTMWHFNARGEYNLPAKIALTAGLDVFSVNPNLQFEDWMPDFLVFGVADLDQYRDNYERIDFGRIDLRLTRVFGRFLLGCDISQLFPIKVKERSGESAVAPGEPPEQPIESLDGHGHRADGGRDINLWLGYSF